MKGVGKVEGWRVYHRSEREIGWENKKTGEKIAMWRAKTGRGGTYVWQVCFNFPKGKVVTFKSKEYALKRIRNYMLKHSGSSKKSKKKSTSKRKSTKKRKKKSSHRRSYGWLVWR